MGKWGILLMVVLAVSGVSGAVVLVYNLVAPPIYQRFYNRGMAYERVGQWQQALEEFDKARSESSFSDEPEARVIERSILRKAGDLLTLRTLNLDEGVRRYWMLVERGASGVDAEYALRRLSELYGQFSINCQLSIPYIRTYLKKYPQNGNAPLLKREMIRCFFSQGEMVQAIVEANDFLNTWPQNPLRPQVLMDMGAAYFVGENYSEAMTIFQNLSKDAGASADIRSESLIMSGRCLLESGMTEAAIEVFKTALKDSSKPQVVQVYLKAAQEANKRAVEQATAQPERKGRPLPQAPKRGKRGRQKSIDSERQE
jgi:hypothetical protein